MLQWLKNKAGDRKRKTRGGGSHCYGRCDGCGNTMMGSLYYRTIYTKLPLPKINYPCGDTHWVFCDKCNCHEIHKDLILRTYISENGDMLCAQCGKAHSANVCYAEMSADEVKELACGFPLTIHPDGSITYT